MSDTQKHLLLVEDEAPLREAIAEQLTDRGYRVEQADSGEAAIAQLADFAFDIIITDLRLPGIDGSAVVEAAVGRYPRHHRDRRHRLRDGEGRGRGDQARRVGFRQQAVSDRRTAARARLRARAAAAEIGERVPARAARGALSLRGDRRQEPADEAALPAARDRRADQQHDSDHRRNRHRQGSRRARDSPQQPAAPAPVRRAELQRDSRDAARSGAVRPRARRVHRRGRQPAGAPRAGAQGHAVPRRSGHDERGAADEAAARAAGTRVRARRRFAHDQGRRARHRRDQQRPRPAGRRRAVPRGSVLPAERHPGAAAAAARTEGRHPAPGAALPRASSSRKQRRADSDMPAIAAETAADRSIARR